VFADHDADDSVITTAGLDDESGDERSRGCRPASAVLDAQGPVEDILSDGPDLSGRAACVLRG
jgi:hypothetical protein